MRAGSAVARLWWRCAGRCPCVRVAWGEGSGGGGVGARGSCQGAGAGPSTGSGRTNLWGAPVRGGGGGGPFDRLRANGFARRACGGLEEGGQGNHEGCTYGEVMACAGRQALLAAEWEVPAAAGRAVREPPLRCVWGVGDATGVGGGGVLPGAPLDSCIRRYDGGDVGVGERCWWRRAPFVCPQDRLRRAEGERIWEGAPTTGCGGRFLLLRGCGRLGRLRGVGLLGGCLGSG